MLRTKYERNSNHTCNELEPKNVRISVRQWHCNPHPTQGWDLTARNVCNNCGGTSNEEEGFTSSAVFHEVGIGYRQTAVVQYHWIICLDSVDKSNQKQQKKIKVAAKAQRLPGCFDRIPLREAVDVDQMSVTLRLPLAKFAHLQLCIPKPFTWAPKVGFCSKYLKVL